MTTYSEDVVIHVNNKLNQLIDYAFTRMNKHAAIEQPVTLYIGTRDHVTVKQYAIHVPCMIQYIIFSHEHSFNSRILLRLGDFVESRLFQYE